jgi:3-oxoacyl-[acyl-carrier protein] reductase
MLIDFPGKTVLITGGSRGIGKACAQLFASLNANVVITYLNNLPEAEQTLDNLGGKGKHALFQLDQSKPTHVARFYEKMLLKYSRVDVLINNAGVYLEHKINEVSYENWQHNWEGTINTNLNGVANLCYFASRHMGKKGGGKIINISSRGAFRGEPDHPAYAASKAGLNAMSQSLAVSLAPQKVSVHVIAPGFVETDMTTGLLNGPQGDAIKKQSPFNRVATTEEVARLAAVYASPGFEFTSSGIIDINGASYLRS